jgi:hypothetical protein
MRIRVFIGNYKNPSLHEIYKYNFNKDVENAHDSLNGATPK